MSGTIFSHAKRVCHVRAFLKNPNRVFSREQLIVTLWGYNANTEERTIDSHVKNIREKLRQAGFPIDEFLQTVWGVGYKWGG